MEIYEFAAIIGFLILFLLWTLYEFRKIKKELNKVKEEETEHASKISALQALATRDPLTGLLNRRGGNELIEHHHAVLSRDRRAVNNFALLNLDLDRFKGINDTYGHAIGDLVLKFFAEILTKNLRNHIHDHDIVIRVGGDEFLILLPECNYEEAMEVVTRIKRAMNLQIFEVLGVRLHLSTSVGIATALAENGKDVLSIEKILKEADRAMYEDKEWSRVDLGVGERRH